MQYYIGLDIGTESIGWAVTDEKYQLLKKRGQDFWGVYLFDEAKTAAERRTFRTARRRTARTHQRLMLLQEIFADEIMKVDPIFFIRLKNSALYIEDKDNSLHSKDALFADADFKDKDYHKRFPSIYHLRNELLNKPADDIRFLYLALHHIIKNRGHFLFENQNFNVKDIENIKNYFYEINEFLSESEKSCFILDNLNDALNVLKDKDLNLTNKTKRLKDLFCTGKDKQLEAILKVAVGGKVKLKVLYADSELEDLDIEFSKDGFEEVLLKIEDAVGDGACLVKNLKVIYDWSVLSRILGEEKYISTAKIKIYEKHKLDLERLKKLVKEQATDKELYRLIFSKKENQANYAAYIGMDDNKRVAKCKTKKEFYDFLKKNLKLDEYILGEIEKDNFLPKQVSIGNCVIPYQVHLAELKRILAVSAVSYPFLNKKGDDGITIAEKIESLLTFRIPYYVGPLNTASPFAWVKRYPGYEKVSITPWNFEKIIDKDASEEGFIRRMTNKCTYLIGEDVLPACSLLYSEFAFLNELNNLKINGQFLPEAKRLIYEYAKENKKVTLSKCLTLLKARGLVEKDAKKEDVFSGIDGDFKNGLASYVTFKEILGEKVDLNREVCEQIIERITLMSSDKNRLEQTLKAKFGKFLTDEEIKRIKGLNYAKWGRFSKKLLTEIFSLSCCDENGEVLSIIEVMRRECKNFMQVLHDYAFQKSVEEYNAENAKCEKVTYKTVEELYCSPSVKRAIWRTLDLVKEITKIMGEEPKKIFVEMARDKEDNGKKGQRTNSRKDQLLQLYSNIKDESREWMKEIEQTEETKFNSKKLVLYYMQKGVCMYSGKQIPLEHVFNTNVCDIEHIYPQSKLKDDSFDNTILVYKTQNIAKGDVYPIASNVQEKMLPYWKQLKDDGFISENKFERLKRKTPLNQEELTDFINRQLVETRQSTKAVANLLKQIYKNCETVYSKAANADDFKQQFNLVKVRELNDLHHAKDAFINIVVGNVYNTKFNHNAAIYFKNNNLDSYNIKYLYTKDIPNAWSLSDKDEIFKTYRKNTCRVVRFTSEGKGKLFDATIKSKGKDLIPLKENGAIQDTQKYGGYDSAATAYFMLVKSWDKKGNVILSLEAISIYNHLHFKGDKQKQIEYFVEAGLKDPEILIDKIKLNTLLNIDGSYAYIRGKTGNQIVLCNANELILDDESVKYLKKISNYFKDKKKYFMKELPVGQNITAEDNKRLYDALVEKLSHPIYSGLSISGQVEFLKAKKEVFSAISLSDQMVVLFEILKLMQCNSVLSDLTKIGGGANAGKILIGKKIQDKKVKIILQSPTGHYRKIIDCAEFL